MPKRTQNHKLEAASIQALQSLLPSDWLYRKVDQDYGIDGEVEIFNKDGTSTALKFLVQLKATDEKNIKKALGVRLSMDKCEYYSRHDLPILLVRYHAPSDSTYIKWFHSFDPYDCVKEGAQSALLKLSAENVWQETTPEILIEEINAFRAIRSPTLRAPVFFDLIVSEDDRGEYSSFHLKSTLKEKTKELREYVVFNACAPHSKATNVLDINSERISARLAGRNAFTVHTPQGYPPERFNEVIYSDLIVVMGIGLHGHGHSSIGAVMVAEHAEKCGLINDINFAVLVADCLSKAGDYIGMMELSEVLIQKEETFMSAQVLISRIVLHDREKLTAKNKERVYKILKNIAQLLERDQTPPASAMHYNCANFLKNSNYFSQALTHYNKARELEEDYKNRAYYWQEIGGVLFEAGHFSWSDKAYKCAIDLGGEAVASALRADCLLYQGKFVEAGELFSAYFEKKEPTVHDSIWILKLFALINLRDFLSIDTQARNSENAAHILQNTDPSKITKEQCVSALQQDALYSFAWFKLGEIAHEQEPQLALLAFLWSAIIVPNDLQAWANVLALSGDNAELHGASLYEAYNANGEAIVRYLHEQSLLNGGDKSGKDIEAFFQEIDRLFPRTEPKTLRYGGKEIGYDFFAQLPSDDNDEEIES